MADGDAAAAAGLAIVAGTADIRNAWKEINKSRDYIANHMTSSAAHPFTAITGTAATAQIPNLDAAKITTGAFAAARIPNLDATKLTTGTSNRPVSTSGGVRGDDFIASDDTYNRSLSSSYRSVYTTSVNGVYGYVASTREVKNLLGVYVPNFEAWMKLEAHWYSYKADPGQSPRLGLIAEELNEFAPELVDHTEGKPDGVKYEQVAVALLGLVQQLAGEVAELRELAGLTTTRPAATSSHKAPTVRMRRAAAKLHAKQLRELDTTEEL